MKLHIAPASTQNLVTAYGDGYIEVNQVRFTQAIVFAPEGAVTPWPVNHPDHITSSLLYQAAGLTQSILDPLAFLEAPETEPVTLALSKPEVLLVGTGRKQYFLPHEVLRPLLTAGVGIEIMDTQAAARTYNILMAEGRRVVAALIPSGDSSA